MAEGKTKTSAASGCRIEGAGLACLLLLLAALASGCGYSFSTSPVSGGTPSLFIPVVENQTSEPGLSALLTNSLSSELSASRRFLIIRSETADMKLSGNILSLLDISLGRRADGESTRRRITVTTSLVLTDREGKAVWSDSGLSDFADYQALAADDLTTRKNRQEAIREAAWRIAQKALERLDAFREGF
ncbi:MAG: LPS assembly lipoprotein LptE [Thermodesulfobacteriota bacterium]